MSLQNLNSDTIAKHAEKVLWNPIDDEAIVLNLQNGYYYTLNAVGREIWKFFDGTHTVTEVGAKIREVYDVSQEQIEHDILELIRECQREELIILTA